MSDMIEINGEYLGVRRINGMGEPDEEGSYFEVLVEDSEHRVHRVRLSEGAAELLAKDLREA